VAKTIIIKIMKNIGLYLADTIDMALVEFISSQPKNCPYTFNDYQPLLLHFAFLENEKTFAPAFKPSR